MVINNHDVLLANAELRPYYININHGYIKPSNANATNIVYDVDMFDLHLCNACIPHFHTHLSFYLIS